MGIDLPQTKSLIDDILRPCLKLVPTESPGWCYIDSPSGIRASQILSPAIYNIAWEAVTHAELNAKGNMPTAFVPLKK